MTTLPQSQPSRHRVPRPSGTAMLAIVGAALVVWAALAVQAAILGDRQNSSSAQLQSQIDTIKTLSGVQTSAFPMEVSDQAKAAPFDASLPAVSAAQVKDISITTTDTTTVGIARGINFQGWSFGDSIPARPIHVRQGDTIRFTLINNGTMGHGMDFHAAQIDPGANYKTVLPGQSFSFAWTANVPGVFMFHCSAGPVIQHIADGMSGAIVVDPSTPLPPAREYVLVQSEYYLKQQGSMYVGDVTKMLAGTPDYVVFNGMVNQYREHPLTANPGELVRLYVVNAGPSQTSAFHVIGAIFSGVYPDGNLNNKLTGVQTYNVPPGGGAMFEFTANDPGTYPFVTHSFADASKGAIGVVQVGQPAQSVTAPAPAAAQSGSAAVATGGTVAVSASDNAFSLKTLQATVGKATTISLTNKGAALHNLHILGLAGADGKDVQTALMPGGQQASVTFTPASAGTYKFRCDVHPAEMIGTLTVK